jgi:hypothetical protein
LTVKKEGQSACLDFNDGALLKDLLVKQGDGWFLTRLRSHFPAPQQERRMSVKEIPYPYGTGTKKLLEKYSIRCGKINN